MHSDPISRKNSSTVEDEVCKQEKHCFLYLSIMISSIISLFLSQVSTLMKNMKAVAAGLNISLAEPGVTQGLPPSSFQRFLRARQIPGLVLTDHQSAFSNTYESMKVYHMTLNTVNIFKMWGEASDCQYLMKDASQQILWEFVRHRCQSELDVPWRFESRWADAVWDRYSQGTTSHHICCHSNPVSADHTSFWCM